MDTRDMACHTWALSGNPLAGTVINRAFESLTNQLAMPYITGKRKTPVGAALQQLRQKHMEQIALLREARTELVDHAVYICGGFRQNAVAPEHLWLEDHTSRRTYDTFINQDVRVIPRVGVDGQPFQPGCEAHPFAGDSIARVLVQGYTKGQVASLP